MQKIEIDRRKFLYSLSMLVAGGVLSSFTPFDLTKKSPLKGYPCLKFNKNGKFKIVQLTDTHYIAGDPRSERALKNVCEMLDAEKPDLVIHTGDIIFGKPAQQSLTEILAPISERKIPWAVALGNHDGQYDLSRKQVFDHVRTLPFNINTSQKEGVSGDSNDVIIITDRKGKPVRALYLFDTHDELMYNDRKSYGSIEHNQVEWYREQSRILSKQNDGKLLPAFAFQHIPVIEYATALADKEHHKMIGNQGEKVCSPNYNSGAFAQIKKQGDIEAIFCGHDHNNDYNMRWHNFQFLYGRFSGCDTVYNDLKPNGCRVIELELGKTGFYTYIRQYGGTIEQKLNVPEDFQ